ncbi:hypothetical protein BSI_09400 [Bacillus inaquosorum KCTC 13429]|uniref:Uncharacterized protein n=1 Tax=Bacillus inaquosorum KCTC 13429 TaxID=1236548 RepID=A0A9W5PDQ1_9BACI|nr:hypothetical protein BSI_09400 [Bacillus inaquosorum KCTC 13429]
MLGKRLHILKPARDKKRILCVLQRMRFFIILIIEGVMA